LLLLFLKVEMWIDITYDMHFTVGSQLHEPERQGLVHSC